MTWYYAADGKQIGPFSEEQFRELIASGTIQPATLVWEARLPNWIPLAQVPPEILPPPAASAAGFAAPSATPGGVLCSECGQTFAPDQVIRLADRNVCATCKSRLVQRLSEGAAPSPVAGLWVTEQQLLEREYRVEIGTALERAWKLFQNNAGPIIGATLLVGLAFVAGWLISTAVSLVIPMANVLLQGFYIGPLTGGLLWYFLRLARGEPATLGDAFAGFSRSFLQLFLASLVQGLIMFAFFIPFFIVALVGGLSMGVFGRGGFGGGGNPFATGAGLGLVLGLVLTGLIALVGIVYLSVAWTHSLALIIDKRMKFWPAMNLSRRMVSKGWGMTFLFLFVAGLISSAGALACLVGLLVTAPLAFAMKVYFYEDNFHDLQPSQT